MKRTNNKGFTIIELLIATVIFSVVLLVITGAIVQFGRVYYKGIVQSRTQERTRAITDSVSKNLQFSRTGSFSKEGDCVQIGNFSYVYRSLPSNTLKLSDNGCRLSGGTEMLGERMQLVAFDVIDPEADGIYNIKVRVVYGDARDFVDNDTTQPCKAVILGGQFCAFSELSTTVVSRLRE